jgi:hypothetical protein
MPIGYTTNTCVSCIQVFICKVDYMIVNTLMYAIISLNHKKVMCFIPVSYGVAINVEH